METGATERRACATGGSPHRERPIAKSDDRTTLTDRPAPVAAERRDGREVDIEISGGGDIVVTGRRWKRNPAGDQPDVLGLVGGCAIPIPGVAGDRLNRGDSLAAAARHNHDPRQKSLYMLPRAR